MPEIPKASGGREGERRSNRRNPEGPHRHRRRSDSTILQKQIQHREGLQVDHVQVQQSSQVKWWIAGAVITLVLVGAGVYGCYNLKSKSNSRHNLTILPAEMVLTARVAVQGVDHNNIVFYPHLNLRERSMFKKMREKCVHKSKWRGCSPLHPIDIRFRWINGRTNVLRARPFIQAKPADLYIDLTIRNIDPGTMEFISDDHLKEAFFDALKSCKNNGEPFDETNMSLCGIRRIPASEWRCIQRDQQKIIHKLDQEKFRKQLTLSEEENPIGVISEGTDHLVDFARVTHDQDLRAVILEEDIEYNGDKVLKRGKKGVVYRTKRSGGYYNVSVAHFLEEVCVIFATPESEKIISLGFTGKDLLKLRAAPEFDINPRPHKALDGHCITDMLRGVDMERIFYKLIN